ncbi:hypothetical protein RDV64_12765 [Acuticoccus sp. MNP-M23]|uniref:shikimate dehydrogenase family protein n=1 Tax=Acuticoccus sp. MNP-M23 TaxID=3072793 RepID=UPI002815E320|nr:hypothetical protein [Acuticoccus sp. MNP-M23]WMS40962.1 hypothetical protein RDV64_12765 [Acuticoccus sp. MNP-M23]
MTTPQSQTGSRVAGDTKLLGIVGDPIAQARSPLVFNPLIAAAGANAVLVPLHVRRDDFDGAIGGIMQIANLSGLVLTLPFKEKALSLADRVLEVGTMVGALNALRREPDGSWTGEMFDGFGLVGALGTMGIAPKGLRFMVLGAGGAGSAIAISLALEGAADITVTDVDGGRAERLAARVEAAAPGCRARAGAATVDGMDVLINATPVGMKTGDGLPAPFTAFPPDLAVVDIVPASGVTPLLALAARCGCATGGAASMVEGQARAILSYFGIETDA